MSKLDLSNANRQKQFCRIFVVSSEFAAPFRTLPPVWGCAFLRLPLSLDARYPVLVNDTLALRALAHVIADDALRARFLDLTGYSVPTLRARAGEADVLQAVIGFLSSHEPDLLRVAEVLGVRPDELAGAMA